MVQPIQQQAILVALELLLMGGKVIYKGSGTNVTVTNLTSTSTYFYKIWSRTGSNWTTGIEINSNTSYVPKFIISEVADPSDDINARFV